LPETQTAQAKLP